MKTDPLKVHAAKQYAERLKRIPSSQWCVGDYDDLRGRHCAVGHIAALQKIPRYTPHFNALETDLANLFGMPTYRINDRLRAVGRAFVQTPKRNILRALNRIIKGKA